MPICTGLGVPQPAPGARKGRNPIRGLQTPNSPPGPATVALQPPRCGCSESVCSWGPGTLMAAHPRQNLGLKSLERGLEHPRQPHPWAQWQPQAPVRRRSRCTGSAPRSLRGSRCAQPPARGNVTPPGQERGRCWEQHMGRCGPIRTRPQNSRAWGHGWRTGARRGDSGPGSTPPRSIPGVGEIKHREGAGAARKTKPLAGKPTPSGFPGTAPCLAPSPSPAAGPGPAPLLQVPPGPFRWAGGSPPSPPLAAR